MGRKKQGSRYVIDTRRPEVARRGRWAASHSFPPYQSEQLCGDRCAVPLLALQPHTYTRTQSRDRHTQAHRRTRTVSNSGRRMGPTLCVRTRDRVRETGSPSSHTREQAKQEMNQREICPRHLPTIARASCACRTSTLSEGRSAGAPETAANEANRTQKFSCCIDRSGLYTDKKREKKTFVQFPPLSVSDGLTSYSPVHVRSLLPSGALRPKRLDTKLANGS